MITNDNHFFFFSGKVMHSVNVVLNIVNGAFHSVNAGMHIYLIYLYGLKLIIE